MEIKTALNKSIVSDDGDVLCVKSDRVEIAYNPDIEEYAVVGMDKCNLIIIKEKSNINPIMQEALAPFIKE